MTLGLLLIVAFFAAYSMAAAYLERTVVTAPMAFLGFGWLMSGTGLIEAETAHGALHVVAEVALILLLFFDASQVDLTELRRRHVWPVRMLVFGLPVAIVLGAGVTQLVMPEWPIAATFLVAAILAPTDAALGQAVVSNTVVPARARRALTVESGLNDGMALPVVLAVASLTAHSMNDMQTSWIVFGARQILVGIVAGAVIGGGAGRAVIVAHARDWTAERFEGPAAVSVALTAYLGATALGGNGFIAAFIAGLCFGYAVRGACRFLYEFTESEGQLLSWAAFLMIGLALIPEAVTALSPASFGIIMASLFVVRPIAIFAALAGTDASIQSKLFFGWFGPRGLATALFALMVAKEFPGHFSHEILALSVNAVWISALLHGISALPGAKWYAREVESMGACAETMPIDSTAKPLRSI